MHVLAKTSLFLTSFIVLLAAGCASDPAPEGRATPAPGPASPPSPPPASCTKPQTGRYMVTVTPKTSCPWWDESDDRASMNVSEDAVRYPHTDDLCGDVQWSGCTLSDRCGPMKVDTGSQGWIATGALSITWTDDTHFTGTVSYDIGHACKMELDVIGERLPL